jgi:hypothetical protein
MDARDSAGTNRTRAELKKTHFLFSCIVLVSLLTACIFGDPVVREIVGVRQSGDELGVRVKGCDASARVTRVVLDDNGRVLWDIEDAAGSSLDTYTAGEKPSTFVEHMPLREALDPARHYRISVTLVDVPNRLRVGFEPAKLDAAHWFTNDGRRLTDAEFDQLEPCR